MIDLDTQPYIERLRAQVPKPQLLLVGGAADLDPIVRGQAATAPAAYVVYIGGDAGEEMARSSGTHEQMVKATLEVLLCARNAADAVGEAAAAAIKPLRAAVLQALVGYTPSADVFPLSRGQDRLWFLKPGVIWWRLRFSTEFLMRVTPAGA